MTIQKLTQPMLKAPEAAPMSIQDAVWIDPRRMGGKPCFRRSRINIDNLLEWMANGYSIQDYMDSFSLTREILQTIILTAGQLIHDTARQTLPREKNSNKNRNSSPQ